jgi:hypothetical protein
MALSWKSEGFVYGTRVKQWKFVTSLDHPKRLSSFQVRQVPKTLQRIMQVCVQMNCRPQRSFKLSRTRLSKLKGVSHREFPDLSADYMLMPFLTLLLNHIQWISKLLDPGQKPVLVQKCESPGRLIVLQQCPWRVVMSTLPLCN